MDIPEIKQLLPKLELEVDEKYGFTREYFLDKYGKKVFVSDPVIDPTKKLVAWVETQPGFDDTVNIKIYQYGSASRLIAKWQIFPVDGSCLICYIKFFEAELILVWRDQDFHVVRIELPGERTEVHIKMIRLAPLVHFDDNQIISYQSYSSANAGGQIARIKIPNLEPLAPLDSSSLAQNGIQLGEFWDY